MEYNYSNQMGPAERYVAGLTEDNPFGNGENAAEEGYGLTMKSVFAGEKSASSAEAVFLRTQLKTAERELAQNEARRELVAEGIADVRGSLREHMGDDTTALSVAFGNLLDFLEKVL